MEIIKIENIGDVAVLGDFRDIYSSAKGFEVCHTSAKPSEVLKKLKNDYAVILHGDYLHAQYLLFYIQRYENELADRNNPAESKRTRLHRLNYIAEHDTFPMFDNITESYSFQEWLPEIIRDYKYLLPARRYNRILTDIKRAADGIDLEGLNSKIYIRPFVYVPFDKSVPAMFMQFSDLIKDKSVIDIGTGTGVLAILAAQMGAKSVDACDINKNAVECAENNIKISGMKNINPEVIHSDLFDNIKALYDVIIFNAPWVKGTPQNLYELAIYDDGYALVSRFMEQAPAHLNHDGVILLQYSDISQKNGDGSMDNLNNIIEQNGLYIADNTSILRRNRLFGMMERVYVFVIKKNIL
jgi:methylase of polypeptide subunit release factors